MPFDWFAVFVGGSLYFLLYRLWFSSWMFGKTARFHGNFFSYKTLFAYFSSVLLAFSMHFFLFVFGSPSTLHGLALAALLWIGLVLPHAFLQRAGKASGFLEEIFSFFGMLFLGAFFGS